MRGLELSAILWYNGGNKKSTSVGACGSFEVELMICDLRSDHRFDHLRLRTTCEIWTLWHEKARFSDKKAPKNTRNEAKNRYFFVWDAGIARSSRVTPTKNQPKTSLFRLVFGCFLYIFYKIVCFQLTTCLPYFSDFIGFFIAFSQLFGKSLFFDYSDADIED